jgi:hypothetical protein
MKRLKQILLVTTLILLFHAYIPAVEMNIPGGVRAVSDGQGTIHLFWYPARGIWPEGGFRVVDASGQTRVERIIPLADIPKDGTLTVEEESLLRLLAQNPAQLSSSASEVQKKNRLILALKSATSPAVARALGLLCSFKAVQTGKQTYTVQGLDKNGRPGSMVMKTSPIDAVQASPLPPAPQRFRTQMSPTGVELSWEKPAGSNIETASYEIERSSQGGEFIRINDKPLLVSTPVKDAATAPQFIDGSAPQEQETRYRLYGLDLFGRRSTPLESALFVPSFNTLVPPHNLSISAKGSAIELRWPGDQHPKGTHYIVERAPMAQGPYQALTPRGVKASDQTYVDKTVQSGGTYFYRLRTVTSKGQLSPPSGFISQQLLTGPPPPPVKDLKAFLGINSVTLTWPPLDRSVAGYLVELQNGRDWARVNDRVWPDNNFEYRYTADQELTLVFRVRSVGTNNQVGAASQPLSIQIRKVPRGKPEIRQTEVITGGVRIDFTFPQDRQDLQFLVFRSASERDEGLVISPALTPKTMTFIDKNIAPGNRYVYRVRAFTAAGWQSEPSPPVTVLVHAAELPIPAKPSAKFEKKPFTHVKISFTPPTGHLRVVVERKTENDALWETLKGEGSDGQFIDANPPMAEQILYRLRYLAADGTPGEPSAQVSLNRE